MGPLVRNYSIDDILAVYTFSETVWNKKIPTGIKILE